MKKKFLLFEGQQLKTSELGKIGVDGLLVLNQVGSSSMVLTVYQYPDWALLGKRYIEYHLGRRRRWI